MCPPILLPSLDPSCDILVRSLQFIQIYRLPYTYHMYKSYGPYRLYMIIWYYMSSRFMDWYHLISIFFSDHRYIIDTWTSILWHLYGISPSDKAHTWPLGAPRPQGPKAWNLGDFDKASASIKHSRKRSAAAKDWGSMASGIHGGIMETYDGELQI